MFCTLSVMENVPPGVTVVGGLLTTVSSRSGPLTVTCVAEALQLLLSFVSRLLFAEVRDVRRRAADRRRCRRRNRRAGGTRDAWGGGARRARPTADAVSGRT